jgi:hypothetical protein
MLHDDALKNDSDIPKRMDIMLCHINNDHICYSRN